MYLSLILHKKPNQITSWWKYIWKLTAPPQTILFFWCILRDKVPTGEHLTHRSFHGPNWCILCKSASESTTHIFLNFSALITLWQTLSSTIHFSRQWVVDDLSGAWEDWANRHKGSKLQSLPLITCWYVWLARNRSIFDNKLVCWPHIVAGVVSAYNEMPNPQISRVRRPHAPPPIDRNTPWAFFDGAANQQGCGGRFILYINDQHFYKVKMGLGVGTNNFAELITLQHLLHFSLGHHCINLNIFGDSKIIINWFNNITACHIHTLGNLLDEFNIFKAQFNNITCNHIYREHNSSFDQLSKEASLLPRGEWMIQEQWGSNEYRYFHCPYIDQHYHRVESP